MREPVARLRQHVRDVLAALPHADVTVLIAAGSRGIHDSACVSFAALGVQGYEEELPVASPIVEHLSRLTQYPMLRGDDLDLAHAVLAALVSSVRGIVPVVPVRVPAGTEGEVLVTVGASIEQAAQDAGMTANVVVAADLSAALDETSPRYRVAGAREWDAAVIEAVEHHDLGRVVELGPDEALRVHALGWAPLVVLHGAAAAGGLLPEFVGYDAPRGVGQLVVRCLDGRDGHRRYEVGEPETLEGVVPRTGDPRG